MKKLLLLLLLSLSKASFAVSTDATIATIATSIGSEIDKVPDLMGAMSYVFGIILGIKAILKLKEYNETKGQQVKIGIPIALAIASALFLGLPKLINIGQTTLFDGQMKSQDQAINWSNSKNY